MTSGFPQRFALAGAFGLVALGTATRARAEQFVVADVTYTHSAQTTDDSHYRVNPTPETPANWASPVDYANGSVHVRLEVKTKPSDAPTRYQICFEMQQNYCCTAQAPPYTAPGVYEWDTAVEDLWRPGAVDFTQGILRSALILKDTSNVKPAPENVGEQTSKLYMPTDLGVTVTVVSAGDVFMPAEDPEQPSGGSGGGGAAGAAGGASAGQPASGGAGGTPPTPAPTGGVPPSAPVVPIAGNAGSAGAPPASPGLAGGEDASCALSAPKPEPGHAAFWAATFGLALLRARSRRKL